MKVNINLTLDVDRDDWTTTFGVVGAASIREDVKGYVIDGILDYGAFGSGEVKVTIIKK